MAAVCCSVMIGPVCVSLTVGSLHILEEKILLHHGITPDSDPAHVLLDSAGNIKPFDYSFKILKYQPSFDHN